MDPQAPQHWTAQALGEAGCSSSSAASGDAHADAWAKYYKDLEAHQQQQALEQVGSLQEGEYSFAPKGDRLLLLDSETAEHEVVPSWARRYALTVWFHGQEPLSEGCPAAGPAEAPLP